MPRRPHCVSWRSWGFFLLLLTTQPGALMSAMTQRGMSPKTVYVVSAALQIAPALTTRAQGIMHAQQARGLPVTGLRGRVRALVPMAGPLILGALTEVGTVRWPWRPGVSAPPAAPRI